VHLNFAEGAWAAWYAYMQNDVLATGLMPFAMHEIVYFGRSPALDHCRHATLFQQVQDSKRKANGKFCGLHLLTSSTAKNSRPRRAMELRQSGPALPFYRRTTTNLALPPSRAILWPFDKCAFPLNFYNGVPDCHFLRPQRHLALLITSSFTYASPVQDDPQDPPSIQCSIWSCRGICFTN
jgi:hypothetical protein